jgi:hypothetical protein
MLLALQTFVQQLHVLLVLQSFVQDSHNILLALVQMVALLCIMVADDTNGCYKLFPIQLQQPFTLLRILQHVTQALIVHCISLCSVILKTQNNTLPCSVGHIFEPLWGDTIKSTSHCLFKVTSCLVALLCNYLLYIFAGVTRHFGHSVLGHILLCPFQYLLEMAELFYRCDKQYLWVL